MTTEDRMPTIGTGYVQVDAPCPECGALAIVVARIGTTLTTPDDDVPTLRLRLKAKPVPHTCRSGAQLTIADALGSPGTVTFSPREDDA